MSLTSYPRPDDANNVVRGCVEVCLRRISRESIGAGLRWIYLDSFFVCLRSCGYGLIFLIYNSPQQQCSGALVLCGLSMTTFRLSTIIRFARLWWGRAMTAAWLQLAPMLVVVARWSINIVVIFIISSVLCTIMLMNRLQVSLTK